MSGGVPAGWVLVPVEPTSEMTEAGEDMVTYPADDFIRNRADSVWSAMLAATPTPPIEGRDADASCDCAAQFYAGPTPDSHQGCCATRRGRDADVERVEKVARASYEGHKKRVIPWRHLGAWERGLWLSSARAALQALGERG